MQSVSRAAIAAALALSAASALPAVAQTDPYGAPPPAPRGGYGPQGPGLQGQGGGHNMQNMTLQQFQARQVANLMKMDTDHDGRVSLAEWTAWREAHPGRGGGQADPARSFARIDLNHDGYITPDEMASIAAKRYARMENGGPGMGPGGENPRPQPLGPQ
jgi:Spy/CpxP family protein refolding chaperone